MSSPRKPVSSAIELGEFANRGLDPGAEIDRVRAVVPLGGKDETVGAVLDEEELAGRRPVAPEDDLLGGASTILRIKAGITCEESRSKLSRGPYRFAGSR